MYVIKWSFLSNESFSEEVYFILRKWSQIEVDKFSKLVFDFTDRLSINPEIGIYNPKLNCFSIVISKQITLYYRILESEKEVTLVLFWNNKQNPIQIKKLLR